MHKPILWSANVFVLRKSVWNFVLRKFHKCLVILLKKDEMIVFFIKKYFVKPKKCIDFYSEGRKTKTKKYAGLSYRATI